MAISPETKRLLQQALKIRNSQVPMHRVMDILATEAGDISEVVHRFRDIRNEDLRRAFHYCAELLRSMESEAGMKPAWETYPDRAPQAAGTGGQAAKSAAAPAPEKSKPAAAAKTRFRPEELETFEDASSVGQVAVAKLFVDGASKGNPGDAGIGAALFAMDGRKIGQLARAIGTATNNIAEYTALIEGLRLAQRMKVPTLFVLSDSELMVRQMTGVYKVKNPDIQVMAREAAALIRSFGKVTISYIGRENNTLADALSNVALPKRPKQPAAPPEAAPQPPPADENPDEGTTG